MSEVQKKDILIPNLVPPFTKLVNILSDNCLFAWKWLSNFVASLFSMNCINVVLDVFIAPIVAPMMKLANDVWKRFTSLGWNVVSLLKTSMNQLQIFCQHFIDPCKEELYTYCFENNPFNLSHPVSLLLSNNLSLSTTTLSCGLSSGTRKGKKA